MIIELYGLPAVGKTTYASKLIKEEKFKDVRIKGKCELLFWNIIFLILHPIRFTYQFYFLVSGFENMATFRLNFLNAFLHRNARGQKARFKKSKSIVLDEGQFQNILSLPKGTISDNQIKFMSKMALKPDSLLVVVADNDIRQKRLLERGYRGRESLGKEYLSKWESVSNANNQRFLELLPTLEIPFKIINIDELA
jgi:deoxyadenosine/deoxycytidine kinase